MLLTAAERAPASSWFRNTTRSSFKAALAPTKVVAQSLYKSKQYPRWQKSLRSATKNASVVMSLTRSKWIAPVLRHTKSATNPFKLRVPRPFVARTLKGPNNLNRYAWMQVQECIDVPADSPSFGLQQMISAGSILYTDEYNFLYKCEHQLANSIVWARGTPPWSVLSCACEITNLLRWLSFGNIIGNRSQAGSSAFFRRPFKRKIPCSSIIGFSFKSLLFEVNCFPCRRQETSLEKWLFWMNLSQKCMAVFRSEAVQCKVVSCSLFTTELMKHWHQAVTWSNLCKLE